MNRGSRDRSREYRSPIYGSKEVESNYNGKGRGFSNPNDSYDRQAEQMYDHDFSKDNWGQDEYVDAGPLNENELKGSRQMHDREHYGSARPDFPRAHQYDNLPNYDTGPVTQKKRFEATPDEYPIRRSLHPSDRKSFSGVGPKNYKRSDSRIEEEVCNILMKDRNIDASDIEVHVRDGVVLLSGTVDSRMDKIEAEMAIEGVTGVEDIQNEIKLKKWGDYSDRPYQRDSADRNPGEKDKDQYY